MSQVQIGDRTFDRDPRRWDEDNRRDASLVVGGLAALFLLAAIVFYGLAPGASGWFLVVSIVVLVLLLIAEAVVLVTGIAREENVGPHWLSEPEAHRGQAAGTAGATTAAHAEPEADEPDEVPEPPGPPEIDLECPECREMFTVEDTGERPLHTECPHCGAAGHVNLDNLPGEHDDTPGDEAAAAGAGAGAEPEHEEISLECPACGTQFDVEDDGTRPLTATCPGCGSSGKLKG